MRQDQHLGSIVSDAVRRDPESGVRLLGDGVAYADGAEDRVLRTLSIASDRSTASDELAAAIVDWPTRYHFSRQRANLLRPFCIGPGMRVLDVGAGTGVLSRYLGESGADVVALEGTLDRARAAATRCAGLPNVDVACGALEALDDPGGFDLVLCVGVYEYAARGGPGPAAAFLARLRAQLRPLGALLLAIENQLGLKYLLGYGEDHAGEPWLGVEGYPGLPVARTFTRSVLATDLRQAGFSEQRWLFPFPDYKLPIVVLDEAAYVGPDAASFVDQLVRWPCSADASGPCRVTDDRRAHRVFVEAGLGPDVANSFLVLAGQSAAGLGRFAEPEVSAWHFGNDRQRRWLGVKRVTGGDVPRLLAASLPDRARPEQGWLRQARAKEAPFVVGRTMEQLALEACAEGAEPLARVLQRWRSELRLVETEAPASDEAEHPFRGPDAGRVLPADHLDVSLSNFVLDAADGLHYIDAEWEAPGPVDSDLVVARALWWFARDLIHRGVALPWTAPCCVNDLAERLALLCGSVADGRILDRWRNAEADFQAKIHGRPPAEMRAHLEAAGQVSPLSPSLSRRLPFTALCQQARGLETELRALRESTSWKVTRPLRMLGRALAGLRRRLRGSR